MIVARVNAPTDAGIALLNLAIRDRSPGIRMQAAETMSDERNVAALVDALRCDPNPVVRTLAAETLGAIRDPRCVPALLEALNQPYWLVRGWAADSLGNFKSMVCVDALEARLRVERRHFVRIYCHGALVRLGCDEHVEPLAEELYAPRRVDQSVAGALLEEVARPIYVDRVIAVAMRRLGHGRLHVDVDNLCFLAANLADPGNSAAASLASAAERLRHDRRVMLALSLAWARSGAPDRAAEVMAGINDLAEVRRWRTEYDELRDIPQ